MLFRSVLVLCFRFFKTGFLCVALAAQAGLKLRNPPASASQVLGLKVYATMPGYERCFLTVCLKGALADLKLYADQAD